MILLSDVWKQIYSSIGKLAPEHGGIIGTNGRVICSFYFDKTGSSLPTSYYPDYEALNLVISEWARAGISFCGMVHSHQRGDHKLSQNDLGLGQEILRANLGKIQKVYFPIVSTTFDQPLFSIEVYIITSKSYAQEKLIII